MWIRTLQSCTGSVTYSSLNLNWLLKHNTESGVAAITAECCFIVAKNFSCLCRNDLNSYLIVTWTIHWSIKAKTHHKDLSTACESYPVTCTTVTPTTLNFLEATNCFFLTSQTTAWLVQEIDLRLRVDSEVKKQADCLPVSEDSKLCNTSCKLLNGH